MDILLWLVPPAAITVAAMVWVSWLGRSRREIDREEAVRRLGEALSEERRTRRPGGYAARVPQRDRSSGVALRPSRMNPPDEQPHEEGRVG